MAHSATTQPQPVIPSLTEVAGHDLLIPPADLTASDQARLLARAVHLDLGDDLCQVASASAGGLSLACLDRSTLDAVADLLDLIASRYSVDRGRFERFTSGPGGLERALALTVAYVRAVGR